MRSRRLGSDSRWRRRGWSVQFCAGCDDFEPDVVHYQAGHLWFNLAWRALRKYPVVLTIHETRHHEGDRDSSKTPQWIKDLGYRRADRVIVHGEQIRRAVRADLGRPDEIIDTIPTVPDIVLSGREPSGLVEGDGRTILFFGRIWPYKGLEYLIRAEPLITEHVPESRILIAGRGEDLDRYRAMIVHPDHFEIDNQYIPNERLVEYFERAAVVVLPYVDGSISGVVPVACMFGKPIVATTAGILPEMVEHGRSGLIVPPRDAEALGEAIVRVLQDDDLRRELGAGARQRAAVFDPSAVAKQTLAVYRRALSGRRR